MSSVLKKCSKCGELKSLSEFNKDSRTKDGYRNNCKACKQKFDGSYRAIKRLSRVNNPINNDINPSSILKKCSKCGELKPLTEFNKDSKNKDGYRSDCKVCKLKVDTIYDLKRYEKFLLSIVDDRLVNLIKNDDIFKIHINSNYWYTKSDRPEAIKALRGLFEPKYKLDSPLCIEENFSQYIATNMGDSAINILMEILFEYCENPDKIKSINDEMVQPINVLIVTNSLALINDKKSHEQMIELLKKYFISVSSVPKNTENTRILYDNLFYALAKIDSHETACNLIELLDDATINSVDIKDLIVCYLSHIPDKLAVESLIKLILMYTDSDDGQQESLTFNSAELLGTISDPLSIPRIIELIKSDNDLIRWNGVYALQCFAKSKYIKELEVAVIPLIDILKLKDEIVRPDAAEALGYLKDERAVQPLIELLCDDDALVRNQAILSLSTLGDKRAVEPLINRIELEDDEDIVMAVIEALGHLKDERALQPLIKRLESEDNEELLLTIIENLGRMKDERALQPLINKFDREDDDDIKYAIITELGHMKDKRAIDFLESRLSGEEEDSDIYDAIMCSIDEINGIIDENYDPIIQSQ